MFKPCKSVGKLYNYHIPACKNLVLFAGFFLTNFPMKEKVAILIDGSNFYFKMKECGFRDQLKFDFHSFMKFLALPSECVFGTYYIGAVKTDGTKKMNVLHSNQQKLFHHLSRNGMKYSLGYLLKSEGRFHEKGVDVHMAVDMLTAAYEESVDRFALVSSDTDLLPAIKKVQSLHKKVEYIGFVHMPSIALKKIAVSTKLLDNKTLSMFYSAHQPGKKRRLKQDIT